jgi:hypothetical protein
MPVTNADIAEVRLRLSGGPVLRGTPNAGVVLFLGNHSLDLPSFLDIYGREGQRVAGDAAF